MLVKEEEGEELERGRGQGRGQSRGRNVDSVREEVEGNFNKEHDSLISKAR